MLLDSFMNGFIYKLFLGEVGALRSKDPLCTTPD